MKQWAKTSFTYLYKDVFLRAEIDPIFNVYPYVQKVYLNNENITDLCGEWVFHDLEQEISKELGVDQ